MTEKYFITPSSIKYGRTPNGVAFSADLYSMDTREKVGTVNNDGDGGATYLRPRYDDKARAEAFMEVEAAATENHSYSELYYEHLMDIAEGNAKKAKCIIDNAVCTPGHGGKAWL